MVRTLLLISLLAVALGSASPAEACRCSRDDSVATALDRAAFVVAGRVISAVRHYDADEARRRRDSGDFSHGPWYGQEIVIEPLRSWKRAPTERISIWTGMGGGDCGLLVGVGQVYIVYVHESSGRYETNSCTRTRLAACAGGELEALGKPAWSHSRVPLESLRFDEFAPLPLLDCVSPPVLTEGNGWQISEAHSLGEMLAIEIDRSGRVIDVSGSRLTSEAEGARLRDEAMRWTFRPATMQGHAVRIRMTVEPRRTE